MIPQGFRWALFPRRRCRRQPRGAGRRRSRSPNRTRSCPRTLSARRLNMQVSRQDKDNTARWSNWDNKWDTQKREKKRKEKKREINNSFHRRWYTASLHPCIYTHQDRRQAHKNKSKQERSKETQLVRFVDGLIEVFSQRVSHKRKTRTRVRQKNRQMKKNEPETATKNKNKEDERQRDFE